jgi:hypothetical protein
MKRLYKVLILSILYITNAWSQDSTKVVSLGDPVNTDHGIKTPQHLIVVLGDKDERTNTQERRVYRKNSDGSREEITKDYLNKSSSDAIAKIDIYRNRSSRKEWQNYSSTEDNPIEKKKTITKSFTVDAKDKLAINNQHGEVKVELWNKNEIKVDITITGYGNSEKKAQELLDNVEIIDKREGEKISFKTLIDTDENPWSWGHGWNWNSKRDDENPKNKKGVEVNYMIYMPRTNALSISNKYGKTIVPQFDAPLRITSNYGSFQSDRLTGANKDIFVQYGSSNIKQMDEGDLQISYSKLNIDKADNLKLKNNYGSVTLDDINNLDGTFQYSSGKIGKINETGKLNISYSDGVQLSELSKTLKSLHINSNYTAVKLPVSGDCNADFEVTTTYANFRYPQGKLTFTVNPDENEEDDRKMGWQSTKTYKGKIGKGSNTKITIKTNYAGVKFMEK